MMNIEEIMAALPTAAPEELVNEAVAENVEDLGGNLLIFSRASVERTSEWKAIMEPEDIERFNKSRKRMWAAECTCTVCGSEWLSGWVGGGEILLYEGEDGCTYPGICELGEEGTKFVGAGDDCLCPYCEATVRGIQRKSLQNGRTYQVMVATVGNVGRYTAVFYWLVSRRIGKTGVEAESAVPVAAAVLDEDGGIKMFTRSHSGGYGKIYPGSEWRENERANDPDIWPYHSADSCKNKKKGAVLLPGKTPDQTGKTGEKTGLESYIRQGGHHPLGYLRFWDRHRSVENLVKAGGWVRVIDEALESELAAWQNEGHGNVKGFRLEDAAFWEGVRPHDILGMTKEEFRKAKRWNWKLEDLELWTGAIRYEMAGPGGAEVFNDYLYRYGAGDIEAYINRVLDGENIPGIREIDKYLKKQNRQIGLFQREHGSLGMYLDYWRMMNEQLEREMTPAELWPGDLRGAHDELVAANRDVWNTSVKKEEFEKIYKKWKTLEWSDGEICIRLPRSNADLVKEGKKLCHCVGTYGENHVNESLVLFVRHARRPERSWYTLNISVKGNTWREIQLHGYGNEWVAKKKLHLTINERVRAFCDRWEKEVLTPVFRSVKAAEKKTKGTKQKKTKEVNVA